MSCDSREAWSAAEVAAFRADLKYAVLLLDRRVSEDGFQGMPWTHWQYKALFIGFWSNRMILESDT